MPKIVQLQFSKQSAGSSALRLHYAFLQHSVESSIVSLNTDVITDSKIRYLNKTATTISRIDGKVKNYINRNYDPEYGSFSYPVLGTNISDLKEVLEADVIYLHWVLGGFLNFSNIEQLAKLNKPIVVIMHDMWYITGGCHYSFACEKYVTGCENCPIIPGEKKNDLSAKGFAKKLKLFAKYTNFHFVSPSTWLYECAKKSFLLKDKPLYYIPNAIDNTLYKPFDKNIARYILNIENNKTVIAFGAVAVSSPYKGWVYLQKALEILKKDQQNDNILILIFGSGYNQKIADAVPFETKFLGYLRDDYSVTVAFNAADVFVVPSLADNQPTTVMESMCCGTPVVGFDIGGIPDMIKHKENGYLAKYKDAKDIATGIKFCINENLKGKVLPVFDQTEVVKKHIDLVNSFNIN